MEKGWVYVLVNSTLPDLAKVGRTTRLPAERAIELSSATGVPTPFVVAFEHSFTDCVWAERAVHLELDQRGLRVAPNREFFRGPAADIARVILDVGASPSARIAPVAVCQSLDVLLADAERHLLGMGETLQDVREAARCYRLAARRGSLVAYERLGVTLANMENGGPASRQRAMRMLKEGARRGNYYCFCEMAALFAAAGQVPNFFKSWTMFFARREDSFRGEVETDPERYLLACRQYLAICLDLGLTPTHLPELRRDAQAILRSMLCSLESVPPRQPQARLRLSHALYSAYRILTPPPRALPPIRAAHGWRPGWHGQAHEAAA